MYYTDPALLKISSQNNPSRSPEPPHYLKDLPSPKPGRKSIMSFKFPSVSKGVHPYHSDWRGASDEQDDTFMEMGPPKEEKPDTECTTQ